MEAGHIRFSSLSDKYVVSQFLLTVQRGKGLTKFNEIAACESRYVSRHRRLREEEISAAPGSSPSWNASRDSCFLAIRNIASPK